jgi:hypothetical protein
MKPRSVDPPKPLFGARPVDPPKPVLLGNPEGPPKPVNLTPELVKLPNEDDLGEETTVDNTAGLALISDSTF